MSTIVVTLVHGTWGRGIVRPSGDAVWTTDSSGICGSLRERFGERIVFRRFRWSGRNSHTARFRAAERLGGLLQEGLNEWPDAAHIVVAHSHGGNVALSALEYFDLRERIDGIVCLATPFISARKRDLGQHRWKMLSGAILVLVLVLLWVTDMFLPGSWNDLQRFGFAVLAGTLLMSVMASLMMGARRRADQLQHELSPAPPPREKLLIIRSPGDEATGALALFQFVSQLSVRLFLVAQSVYVRFEHLMSRWAADRKRVLLVGVIALAAAVASLVAYVQLSSLDQSTWPARIALAAFAVSFVLMAAAIYVAIPFMGVQMVTLPFHLLVSSLMWPVMGALSALLIIPFGWQAAVANILLDVTAEATPPGSWESHLVEPPTSEEIGASVVPLMHMVYENPRVQDLLGEWMEERRLLV